MRPDMRRRFLFEDWSSPPADMTEEERNDAQTMQHRRHENLFYFEPADPDRDEAASLLEKPGVFGSMDWLIKDMSDELKA